MTENKQERVYIAGPMRGHDDWNFPAFDEAQKRLEQTGYTVISPANLCRQYNDTPDLWDTYTEEEKKKKLRSIAKIDLDALATCDTIALLPGWQKSTGTTMELAYALFVHLRIISADTLEDLPLPKQPWHWLAALENII